LAKKLLDKEEHKEAIRLAYIKKRQRSKWRGDFSGSKHDSEDDELDDDSHNNEESSDEEPTT
jgi:hypothetical protein